MDGWKTLLGDVAEILRQNRWLAWLSGGLCALAVAAVAVSCATRLAAQAATGEPAGAEQAATTGQATELTDAQVEVRNSMTQAAADLWAQLEAYRWIAPDGAALAFGEGGWTDAEGNATAAVVSSTNVGAAEAQTATDNEEASATVQVTSFSLLLADGSTTLGRLTTVTAGDAATLDLEIDVVSTSKAFTAYAASSDLVVEDGYGELAGLFGGGLDALTERLRAWASSSAPDATKATWDGTSTADRRQGTVSVTLELDDAAQTRLVATYAAETGVIDIEEA